MTKPDSKPEVKPDGEPGTLRWDCPDCKRHVDALVHPGEEVGCPHCGAKRPRPTEFAAQTLYRDILLTKRLIKRVIGPQGKARYQRLKFAPVLLPQSEFHEYRHLFVVGEVARFLRRYQRGADRFHDYLDLGLVKVPEPVQTPAPGELDLLRDIVWHGPREQARKARKKYLSYLPPKSWIRRPHILDEALPLVQEVARRHFLLALLKGELGTNLNKREHDVRKAQLREHYRYLDAAFCCGPCCTCSTVTLCDVPWDDIETRTKQPQESAYEDVADKHGIKPSALRQALTHPTPRLP